MSRPFAVLLALSLLLSACGRSESPPPETTSPPISASTDSVSTEPASTEPITVPPETTAPEAFPLPLDQTLSPALRERRDALQRRFGIVIAMGEEIRGFPDHRAEVMRDETAIGEALTLLERELARYPDGFLSSLGAADAPRVVFCLTGALSAKSTAYLPAAGAIYTHAAGETLLAYDLTQPFLASSLHHEISHAIDAKLAELLPAAHPLFTEWEGDYLYAYTGHEGQNEGTFFGETDPDRMHYISSYSKTFPQEDRAVLFEYLMFLPSCRAFESPHIRAKLACYLAAMRDGFAFPEQTEWERLFASLP